MNEFFRLIFVMNGNGVINAGKSLCETASSPEERKIAAAFRRVYFGTIILAALVFAALIAVTIMNNPFLDSGTKRYGTVRNDGKIGYVQGETKYISAEKLGFADYELKSGDRVIIFFDKNDEIKSAYPQNFYEKYTENRVLTIVFAALLGITVLMIYAFVICRLTPFGRPWYLYCREIKNLGIPKISRKKKAVIYAIAAVVAIAVLTPQIAALVGEIREMREIEEFGRKIKSVREAAEKAQEMSDNLIGLDEKLSDNSALDKAKSAAEKIGEIKNNLKNTQSR